MRTAGDAIVDARYPAWLSDTRKATALAVSTASKKGVNREYLLPSIEERWIAVCFHKQRHDDARRHAVDADAVRAPFQRGSLAELQEPALALIRALPPIVPYASTGPMLTIAPASPLAFMPRSVALAPRKTPLGLMSMILPQSASDRIGDQIERARTCIVDGNGDGGRVPRPLVPTAPPPARRSTHPRRQAICGRRDVLA